MTNYLRTAAAQDFEARKAAYAAAEEADYCDHDFEARQNDLGWYVFDGGQVWWPNEDAQAEIAAAEDPEEAVLAMCTNSPMRGEWHN